jgi:uncharacterized protein YfiM (DUF2279 family)
MPTFCAAAVMLLQCLLAPPMDVRLAAPAPASAYAEDAWLGEDKVRHFAASYAVVAFGYGGGRAAGLGTDAALAGAIVMSAAAGIWKEFHDRATHGLFSYRDLVWDAAGILTGVVLVRQVR